MNTYQYRTQLKEEIQILTEQREALCDEVSNLDTKMRLIESEIEVIADKKKRFVHDLYFLVNSYAETIKYDELKL